MVSFRGVQGMLVPIWFSARYLMSKCNLCYRQLSVSTLCGQYDYSGSQLTVFLDVILLYTFFGLFRLFRFLDFGFIRMIFIRVIGRSHYILSFVDISSYSC